MKIRSKLMLSILVLTSLAYAISVGYLVFKLRNISLRDAYEKADLSARESANMVRTYLNQDMDISRTMVHAMHHFRGIPQNQRAGYFINMIRGVADENPNILSVWGSWEINALDSTYKKPYGRHRFTFYRENGVMKYKEETLNTDGDAVGSGYHNVKLSKRETMIDPYWFAYTDDSPLLLEASTAVPLLEDDVFRGLFGLDIELTNYQSITKSVQPFEGSYSLMLSHNSTIVGHPNDELLGEPFAKYYQTINDEHGITEKVFGGQNFAFNLIDSITGEEYYATFAARSEERRVGQDCICRW